jgi:deoxyadenosine/deoxycytidine kinase
MSNKLLILTGTIGIGKSTIARNKIIWEFPHTDQFLPPVLRVFLILDKKFCFG